MLYKIPNQILDLLMPISRSTDISPFQLIEEAIFNQLKTDNKESMHDTKGNNTDRN
jgi:hypothetical protein